ncbi:hypothetical protein CALCODRAFT_46850 [Calocera cornea HHB12733]|uniref:Uncharacterized protein n=1 Tax=Calocera cornea HHB12733 TaxID=1353952 RepID=A0A165J048_9BASI|nr:hypothetical protein CALCODRAFT_46850 [Calocera cornea HHB12733]
MRSRAAAAYRLWLHSSAPSGKPARRRSSSVCHSHLLAELQQNLIALPALLVHFATHFSLHRCPNSPAARRPPGRQPRPVRLGGECRAWVGGGSEAYGACVVEGQ